MSEQGEICKSAFQIGAILVKPDRNLIDYNGALFSLEPRIMDVLCALAAQPRTVISRQDLIDRVWQVEFGADESLTRAISVLRKTFKQAGETDKFIQTISKRGYRLARDVSKLDTASPDKGPILTAPHEQGTTLAAANTQPEFEPPHNVTVARPQLRRRIITRALLFVLGLSVLATLLIFLRPQKPFGSNLAIAEYGRSVAVLSFTDMSPAGDQEYFSDGLAEELLNALVQIPDLRIAGRASSFAYKGKNVGAREIGKALGVSLIIDGALRKQGEQVRVTVQLINVSDGSQIWSKSYDGSLADTFLLQERISQDIVTELTLLLGIKIGKTIELEQ